ncbi:hypothetical protein FG386_001672 [Cryptosporidium ryanae]|uniref:uncharacterized protein n=1 Tax=Cryptosporidium ryanae TaxID=515981 RepID=UPI00351A9608|nr:hypothetical protein FG386_001672 [Cryptosporidium ryanae]
MNTLDNENDVSNNLKFDEIELIESDSDLFGDDSDIIDDNKNQLGENDDSQHEPEKLGSSGFESNNINDVNDSDTYDGIKYVNIKSSASIPIFENRDRTFLTFKLPKRLNINYSSNSNRKNEFDDDMNIVGYVDSNGKVKSNTKLVSWSDGSYSLIVNGKISYDCLLGIENAMLFDNRSESNYKQSISRIDQKFTIRPIAIEKSNALRDSKSRVMIPTTLDEINQIEVESRKRNEELNILRSMKLEQKNHIIQQNRRQMTSSFLEDSSEEEI